jgi:hypothetical protein
MEPQYNHNHLIRATPAPKSRHRELKSIEKSSSSPALGSAIIAKVCVLLVRSHILDSRWKYQPSRGFERRCEDTTDRPGNQSEDLTTTTTAVVAAAVDDNGADARASCVALEDHGGGIGRGAIIIPKGGGAGVDDVVGVILTFEENTK